MRSDWPEPKPHGSYVCTVGCSQIERQSSFLSTANAVWLGFDLYAKSNPWYNGDCLTWEKFTGETKNSHLHFKISTSSFQTKLFSLCTRVLRGNRLHRPFRAATGDIFYPFHLGR